MALRALPSYAGVYSSNMPSLVLFGSVISDKI